MAMIAAAKPFTAEELEEMAVCDAIVAFAEQVMAGTHPRVKIPIHLVRACPLMENPKVDKPALLRPLNLLLDALLTLRLKLRSRFSLGVPFKHPSKHPSKFPLNLQSKFILKLAQKLLLKYPLQFLHLIQLQSQPKTVPIMIPKVNTSRFDLTSPTPTTKT